MKMVAFLRRFFLGMMPAENKAIPIARREPSDDCYELIRHFEGLRDIGSDGRIRAYLDPVGIPTIGWGTIQYKNGRKVKMGDVISIAEAEELLEWEVGEKARAVAGMIAASEIRLTQGQFDALVSFAYNLGTGALSGSTLLRKLRMGHMLAASDEFLKWNKGRINGKLVELRGLTRRRKSERALFLGEGLRFFE